MNAEHHRISARTRISIVIDDVEVDEDVLKALLLVDILGSISQASRVLGTPYSRVWEKISRIEKAIGEKLIDSRRGGYRGGGSKLTPLGKKIVELYLRELRSGDLRSLEQHKDFETFYLYAGSHDPLVEKVLSRLCRERGCRYAWLGSLRGLSLFIVGRCAIAGIHIMDPDTGEYNTPFLKKLMLEDLAIVKGLFLRTQGFMTRGRESYEHIVDGLLSGRLRLVNRCWGSGTRMLLDSMLRREAVDRGINPKEISILIQGYDREVSTHDEVAQAVKLGQADVGLGIEFVASINSLNFVPTKIERFDVVIRKDLVDDELVVSFIEMLEHEIEKSTNRLPGYTPIESG